MNYASLLAALRDAASVLEPSSCDGLICGMLCVRESHDAASCANEVAAYFGLEDGLAPGVCAALADLREHCADGLASTEFEFKLLLPDDATPLAARADAFRGWCASFLYGLGAGGLSDRQPLGEQAREALVDLAEFTRMDPPDDAAASEDEERALFELTEYVQVAVVLLREELRAVVPATASNVTIH